MQDEGNKFAADKPFANGEEEFWPGEGGRVASDLPAGAAAAGHTPGIATRPYRLTRQKIVVGPVGVDEGDVGQSNPLPVHSRAEYRLQELQFKVASQAAANQDLRGRRAFEADRRGVRERGAR